MDNDKIRRGEGQIDRFQNDRHDHDGDFTPERFERIERQRPHRSERVDKKRRRQNRPGKPLW